MQREEGVPGDKERYDYIGFAFALMASVVSSTTTLLLL